MFSPASVPHGKDSHWRIPSACGCPPRRTGKVRSGLLPSACPRCPFDLCWVDFGQRCPRSMCGVHAQTSFRALGPSPVQVEPLVFKIHGCIRSKWLLQRSPDWASHGRRSLPKYHGTSLCLLCGHTCSDLAKSCCKRPRPRTIQRLRSKPRPCL